MSKQPLVRKDAALIAMRQAMYHAREAGKFGAALMMDHESLSDAEWAKRLLEKYCDAYPVSEDSTSAQEGDK